MTSEEFNTFKNRLFVMYPSVNDWLTKNSPDVLETMRSWFRRLERYTLLECFSVLEGWEQSNSDPFKAYERDQLPSIVASVIDKQRSKRAEREKNALDLAAYESAKRGRVGRVEQSGLLDSGMRRAVELGVPIHRRFLDGELTPGEYQTQLDAVINRELGIAVALVGVGDS